MISPTRPWHVTEVDPVRVQALAGQLGVVPAVAAVYLQRGLETPDQVRDFCDLGPHRLHDPLLLPDIEPALDRLERALDSGERIFVFGDYDVDGITATAVMVRTLKALKANFSYHVPHRIEEGYDLRTGTIDRAIADDARLILSVDCGIVAFEAAEYAHDHGVDLIITDHHQPDKDGRLPRCVAVVNPGRGDSQYPFRGLAGVGIAFKLALALCARRGIPEEVVMKRLSEYVALGTVADVAPMLDENRSLVALGCRQLTCSAEAGVRALLQVAGVKRLDQVSVGSIGFGLGPRINAVGRIGSPATALELLLTQDPERAEALAAELDSANRTRQAMEKSMVERALAQVPPPEELPDTYALVVWGEDWHPGLAGLVAGRLASQYSRPTLACTFLSEDTARGSCRSAGDFNILTALRSPGCHALLTQYGGHAFAAGFTLPAANLIPLRERLNEYARQERAGRGPVQPLQLEAVLRVAEMTPHTYTALQRLAPCGSGNPEPLFLAQNLTVAWSGITQDGKHLRLQLRDGIGGRSIPAIAFGRGAEEPSYRAGTTLDAAFTLSENEYNGLKSLQMMVRDIRPSSE